MEELPSHFPTFYSNVSLVYPVPSFVDQTNDTSIWNDCIKSENLMTSTDICNTYVIRNFRCDWGCSKFIHKMGYLDFYIVIQRFISKVIIFDMNCTEIATVDPARVAFFKIHFMTMIYGYAIQTSDKEYTRNIFPLTCGSCVTSSSGGARRSNNHTLRINR